MPRRLRLRKWLYVRLAPEAWQGKGLSPLNFVLGVLILLSVAVAIAETEPLLAAGREATYRFLELLFGAVFLAEYAARLWTAVEGDDQRSAFERRLKFIRSPSSVIDLIVLVVTFAPFIGVNGQVLRLIRLLRIIRIAKLGRMSSAMRHLIYAVMSRRYELALTMMLAACLLVFGASALYWIEGDLQPDKFGSIPRSLWWAIITLTTIGYGDVYPITVLGKVIAGMVAVAGIGLIAMPTGILAAAFSEALQRDRKSEPDA